MILTVITLIYNYLNPGDIKRLVGNCAAPRIEGKIRNTLRLVLTIPRQRSRPRLGVGVVESSRLATRALTPPGWEAAIRAVSGGKNGPGLIAGDPSTWTPPIIRPTIL